MIGVLPQGFEFALGNSPQFWTALQPDNSCEKDCAIVTIFMRSDVLKTGSLFRLRSPICSRLRSSWKTVSRLEPESGASVMLLSEAIVGDIRPILLLLLSGAGLLLLIACVNVFEPAGAALRKPQARNCSTRRAGRSRARLGCQFVTEGMVLVVGGGSGSGLAFANGVMQILSRLSRRR